VDDRNCGEVGKKKIMKKLIYLRLLFGGLLVVLVGAVTLVLWRVGQKSVLESGGSIEEKIKRVLPAGAFLRDYSQLGEVSPETYLVIYVEEGYQVSEDYPGPWPSCPAEILGEYPIKGMYHLVLFRNGKLEGDVVIPTYEEEYVLLPYQDVDREVSPLIKLADYTGDGKEFEILLTTTSGGCGFFDGIVVGYDLDTQKLLLYSDWLPRFQPDASGKFEYLFECGDHGNETRVEEEYGFNGQTKRYEKTSQRKTDCNELFPPR